MLDECANLGELDVLRKAVTLLRGYGLQVWMFFQDVSQLEFLYPGDYKTMINNCGVVQTFGLSRRSGANPIATIIGGYKPTEILKLDRSQQILSISPGKVRTARLMRYFKDDAFEQRFDDNPLIRKNTDEAYSNNMEENNRPLRFS
jgi:type IV secretion system protein VirD4